MHHLVVADGQHKVFAKGVEKAKGNAVVVALAEQWIQAHIPEHIVHPAHIPLKVKAQAAYIRGHGDHGPSRGLLSDHHHGRVAGEHRTVQLAEEVHRLVVLVAAVLIGGPFSRLSAVIQVQHTGHCVHPNTVKVEQIGPVHGRADEKRTHFIFAVVKDPGAPFLVLAFFQVAVLVGAVPIKCVQPVRVLGKVSGHPVQDHANPHLVTGVHKVH